MLKVPTVINYATTLTKEFSFLVKEGIGRYQVYDCFTVPIERKLPRDTHKTKHSIDLLINFITSLNFKVKRIDDLTIEYVDPDCEEYEDVDLPLYKKTSEYKTFSYLGTNYTLKNVPTKKTVEAAEEYKRKIMKVVEQEFEMMEIKAGISDSLDKMSFIYTTKKDVSKILDLTKYLVIHLRVPYTSDYSYRTLILDKEVANEKVENDTLTLIVPDGIVGLVIGKGGKNCKAISKELGIKRINVVAG